MKASRVVRMGAALAYFLFCNYLFFLPGDAFPKEDWLDRIYFDKWVHIGLFVLMALLLGWALPKWVARRYWLAVLLLASWGGAVELIQGAWIVNRSSDWFDLLADSIGAVLGCWSWRRWFAGRFPA